MCVYIYIYIYIYISIPPGRPRAAPLGEGGRDLVVLVITVGFRNFIAFFWAETLAH